jgi:WD40 repeat protein
MKHHCLNTYRGGLAWIPKRSRIRQRYAESIGDGRQVVMGVTQSWGSLEQVLPHPIPVNSVAVSSDGTRVVSGSADNSIRIWNASTGEIEQVLEGHTNAVMSVAFSRTCIVSGSRDKSVRIWNATTGEIQRILKGHSTPVKSVGFSSDGTRVVSGSEDKTIRIWNATSGEREHILEGHSGAVNSVSFSPDGTRVVSGSDDRSVRIWSACDHGGIEANVRRSFE